MINNGEPKWWSLMHPKDLRWFQMSLCWTLMSICKLNSHLWDSSDEPIWSPKGPDKPKWSSINHCTIMSEDSLIANELKLLNEIELNLDEIPALTPVRLCKLEKPLWAFVSSTSLYEPKTASISLNGLQWTIMS